MLLYCFTLVFVRVERRSALPVPPGSDADDDGKGPCEVELSNGYRPVPSPPPGRHRLRPRLLPVLDFVGFVRAG
jgi:hypothetical protein